MQAVTLIRPHLRSLSQVVAESASLVQHLGEGGSSASALLDGVPAQRTSKPRAARATNFAGMCRAGAGGASDDDAADLSARHPRKRGRPSAVVPADIDRDNVVPFPSLPDGVKRPRLSRSPALWTPSVRIHILHPSLPLLFPSSPVLSRSLARLLTPDRDSPAPRLDPSFSSGEGPSGGRGGGGLRRRQPGAQDAVARAAGRRRPGKSRTVRARALCNLMSSSAQLVPLLRVQLSARSPLLSAKNERCEAAWRRRPAPHPANPSALLLRLLLLIYRSAPKKRLPDATPLSPRRAAMSPVPFPSLDAVAVAEPEGPGKAPALSDVFGARERGNEGERRACVGLERFAAATEGPGLTHPVLLPPL